MDEQLASMIGSRVRAARAANRQTQVLVAGLTGITTDYLYQIERGKKLPTIPVLVQLARILDVPLSSLLDPASTPTRPPIRADVGQSLHRALTHPVTTKSLLPVTELHNQVIQAWQTWQTSPNRYSRLSAELPALIGQVAGAEEAHRAEGEHAERRATRQCAVDLYGLLRTVSKRMGRLDLALLVADRGMRAAEAADDPLRLAAARWNLAHVLLAEDEVEGAELVAMQAADAIRPLVKAANLDATGLYGALVLLGAVASVRQGAVWTARERVQEVAPLAERTGERNIFWTAFGPTNVAMYAVSIEVEAGESGEALRLAERVGYEQSPSIERRVAFLLEQATGHEQRRDYASTLLLLQTASREAPEDVANRPAAHRLLNTVIRHGRRSVAGEAVRLATAVGAPLS
jgi:transcriptional regulator with XRE-family HTH domain